MSGKAGIKRLASVVFFCVFGCAAAFGARTGAKRERVYTREMRIPGGRYEYEVRVGGSLDEFNTADYLEAPLGSKNVGHQRLKSKFQPNKYLVIENTGDKDVVNPRFIINGKRNWYSAEYILAGILKRGMSTEEKAMAIWRFVSDIKVQCHDNDRRVGNGSLTKNKELSNPVKLANSYYCSGCQFAAAAIVVLCRRAGIPAEDARTVGLGNAHRVAEIRWDGDWHVLDGDERMFHLERDNKTLASIADIADDPELCDRTHGGGFASRGLTKKRGIQYKENKKKINAVEDIGARLSDMSMTLRPGERFVWRWDNKGKYRCGDNRRNIKPNRPEGLEPYQLANGEIVCTPKLTEGLFEKGVYETVNIRRVDTEDNVPQLRPIEAGKKAYVIYKVESPYPVVGGKVGADVMLGSSDDNGAFYISVYEPNNWKRVWFGSGHHTYKHREYSRDRNIDEVLDPKPRAAIYEYYIKYEIFAKDNVADAAIDAVWFGSDLQMSAASLPSLSAGVNKVIYVDDSGRGGFVNVIHGWSESTVTLPPLAPAGPAEPNDGVVVDLKSFKKFTWQAAKDRDAGGYIADYHIQVSTRADMRWPVSPNFDRITFASHALWPVPKGWLRPNQKYYWRVRARDNWGAWSWWSKVWSFTTIEGEEKESKKGKAKKKKR